MIEINGTEVTIGDETYDCSKNAQVFTMDIPFYCMALTYNKDHGIQVNVIDIRSGAVVPTAVNASDDGKCELIKSYLRNTKDSAEYIGEFSTVKGAIASYLFKPRKNKKTYLLDVCESQMAATSYSKMSMTDFKAILDTAEKWDPAVTIENEVAAYTDTTSEMTVYSDGRAAMAIMGQMVEIALSSSMIHIFNDIIDSYGSVETKAPIGKTRDLERQAIADKLNNDLANVLCDIEIAKNKDIPDDGVLIVAESDKAIERIYHSDNPMQSLFTVQ